MNKHFLQSSEDTIVALATPEGTGAIAVIRISGKEAFPIVSSVFKGKDPMQQATHTIHFGTIRDGERILDEVLVSLFKGPRSFTKEDVIEISCHGSQYIAREILQLLIRKGARPAQAGEFTKRAFMNGQFDLAQAEAVADVIAADSEAAHIAAIQQLRGGFSGEIKNLREELIAFASLVELELDFSEEDVEFADRKQLKDLINRINVVITSLLESFHTGNAIRNGIPTVIAGKPNAGKSTLLNALLKEEKAIVSEIPGTTRDFIEDVMVIGGVSFRFVDTAGLRHTTDTIEAIGVERTRKKMSEASLILLLFDVAQNSVEELQEQIEEIQALQIPYVVVGNKIDQLPSYKEDFQSIPDIHYISAHDLSGLEELKLHILAVTQLQDFRNGSTVVTNVRHYQSLLKTREHLTRVLDGLGTGITGDFLAEDIRSSLYHLGEITGEITHEDLLDNIFSKFCIGK